MRTQNNKKFCGRHFKAIAEFWKAAVFSLVAQEFDRGNIRRYRACARKNTRRNSTSMNPEWRSQVSDLANKQCVPCKGGVPPLNDDQNSRLLKEVPGWAIEKGHLCRTYTFPD